MPKQKQVVAVRLAEQIVLDGVLSEAVWQNGSDVTGFIQREPVEGGEPTEKTIVRVAYDDDALYIGAQLVDSAPDSIVARLGRRDAIIRADQFICFIDPYYDRRSGFYFGINAGGTRYDGTLFNDEWDDESWDGVWEGKAAIDNQGWTAELCIPFSQLRFKEKETYTWGINFRRDIQRKNEKVYLVFTPKKSSGFVSRFVDLVGIENIHSSRYIEILPYMRTKAEYIKVDTENPFHDGSKYLHDIGMDLKYGIGSNLTLDMTLNPDFGQVEVDPAVVNLSDVETFFEEKRPFFIEGAQIFQNFGFGGARNFWGFNFWNPDFFYSRRIGRAPQASAPDYDYAEIPEGAHILGAGKVTGKIGNNWTVGTIHALTQKEIGDFTSGDRKFKSEMEPLTYYGIFRIQKEMNESRQGLGMISTLTSRKFDQPSLRDEFNKDAFAFGIDGWTFLDTSKTWVIAGWAGASHVRGTSERMIELQRSSRHYFQRPDANHVRVDSSARSLTGHGARMWLNKQKGNVIFNAALGALSPGLDVNDAGFMWRSDLINGHIGSGYQWVEPGKITRETELIWAIFQSYDYDMNSVWRGIFHLGWFRFVNYYTLEYMLAYNPETINNSRTRGGPLTLNPPGWEVDLLLESDDRKAWVFNLSFCNYSKGKNNWEIELEPMLEWKPRSNVSLAVGPEIQWERSFTQWVDCFEDPLATHTYGKRYVFAEMKRTEISANIRLNWTFTPKFSLQLYLQPLVSHGDYANFKELVQPKSYDFRLYSADAITLVNGDYQIDPDGAGSSEPIQVSDPDFHVKSLRGNAVLRWEYSPGSTLYLVWTQRRSDEEYFRGFNFRRSFNHLWHTEADNIFMLKWTYWWSL
ncbi:carbohydrate binding family 9 domain-containing protein [candidate division KSB1 bacterium]|nr:carbohydrate binding family 9 domain-containing protein [candidate division KSB1 bacterium]